MLHGERFRTPARPVRSAKLEESTETKISSELWLICMQITGSAPPPLPNSAKPRPRPLAAVGAPRRSQAGRTKAVQIRLAPEELAVLNRAAREWARDQPRPRRRRRKPAAGTKDGRRYSAVPKYIRAVVLAAAADTASPSTVPAGDTAPVEAYPATALRLEVRRVGQLLNQALRMGHELRKRDERPDVAQIQGHVEEVGRVLHQVLAEVAGR